MDYVIAPITAAIVRCFNAYHWAAWQTPNKVRGIGNDDSGPGAMG